MTVTAAPGGRAASPWLFSLTVFVSAGLVFLVEPIVARLILPVLGGSAAVWNASLAFFQLALMAGYVYAHLLRRLPSIRAQLCVHLCVLALAALSLPLTLSPRLGAPDPAHPALWLMGALLISIGPPFAALSATAPLLQAWHARVHPHDEGGGPWGLYAASNFGSFVALLAYPALVEPLIGLRRQTVIWSLGYAVFLALAALLVALIWRRNPAAEAREADDAPVLWRERAIWVALAAVPSSLMLGVTTYVTTDVGSAPFLWLAPLALYLLTFIIAFQERPQISPRLALMLQALSVVVACALTRPMPRAFVPGLLIHFANFFLSALVCHQALVARRPGKGRLTDFYLCMSLGGVLGGSFNAFLAPVLFTSVAEYPAMLAVACLARPWGVGRPPSWAWTTLGGVLILVASAIVIAHPGVIPVGHWAWARGDGEEGIAVGVLLALAAALAFALRRRAVLFTLAALVLAFGGGWAADRVDVVRSWRGFFGVLRVSRLWDPRLGGEVRMLAHGTTLHGAEATAPRFHCQPLLYYAHETPIGQVFDAERAARPALVIGAVGMGTGSVAAYGRPADRFQFFEIDPLVVRLARDPRIFGYLTQCATSPIDQTLGDARLTLGREPDRRFDILLIDAFSSDSVPAHLLTVEAVRLYLSKIKPDGVVILHLSNRNLDLVRPAQAAALAAGGYARFQSHHANPFRPSMWEASEDALIIARGPAGLAPFDGDARWRPADGNGVRPWTDDHTDLLDALIRRIADRLAGRS